MNKAFMAKQLTKITMEVTRLADDLIQYGCMDEAQELHSMSEHMQELSDWMNDKKWEEWEK